MQSQVIQTPDEIRQQYQQKIDAMNAANAGGPALYQKMKDDLLAHGDAGDVSFFNAALGGSAPQLGAGGPDAMSDIWNSINPSLTNQIMSDRFGGAWNDLHNWSPQSAAPLQAEQRQKLDAMGQAQQLQAQAYDKMQGGGFAGGVLSGGAQTSMFGTPMAGGMGGLGGLGGYNPSGGFGQPGSQQSQTANSSGWGAGAFGQPQGGGAGGPFSVKNPWSFS